VLLKVQEPVLLAEATKHIHHLKEVLPQQDHHLLEVHLPEVLLQEARQLEAVALAAPLHLEEGDKIKFYNL